LLVMAGPAKGATITVGPGEGFNFNTIQAGIDAAVDGDTVLVAPDEYIVTEPVTFRGKAITVKSETGRDETTIRMGTPADSNRGSVIIFENGETTASILEGFTITGGKGFWLPSANAYGGGGVLFNASFGTVRDCAIVQNSTEYGGGICCVFTCSPRLTDCTIVENSAEENGGGVLLWSGPSLTMSNCTIRENSATRYGAGLHCWQDSSLTMTDCAISKNSVTGDTPHVAGYGGGLCCMDSSMLTLTNCNIVENSAGIGGGGIHCWNSCLLELTSCAIMENSVTIVGGGMFCEEHSSVTMTNCIVSGNSATGRHQDYPDLGGGGGMDFWGNTSLTLSNCTITGNSAAKNAGGMICDFWCSGTVTNSIVCGNTAPITPDISLIFGSTLDITYTDVAGGRTAVNIEGGSILNWGLGNIASDPCFADSENDDCHLKSQAGRWTSASSVEPDPNSQAWVQDDVTSPCIDAGDPNSDWTAELWPHGERINMGAYGGTSQASRSLSNAGNVADLNRDGIVDSADMRIMVDHWGTDEPLCDIGPMPWGDGIIDVQDLIVLAENLFEEIPPIE
jgi:hypothetical protein